MHAEMIVLMVILTLSHLSEFLALEEQISVAIIFKRLFIFYLKWNGLMT